MKHRFNKQTVILERLFFKGDEIYIDTQTYREGGSSTDWMRVFNSDRKLIGSISNSNYWTHSKNEAFERVTDDSPSYVQLKAERDRLEEAFLELLASEVKFADSEFGTGDQVNEHWRKRAGLI